MTSKSTRNLILQKLHQYGPLTSCSLADLLSLSPASIRFHLRNLEKEGVIQFLDDGLSISAGRKPRLYTVTPPVKETLLPDILSALFSRSEDKEIISSVKKSFVIPHGTLVARLNSLVSELNRFQYNARWEAASAGPQIMLYICPYLNLLSENNWLCAFDCDLFEDLIGHPVRKKHSKLDQRRLPCTFRLN